MSITIGQGSLYGSIVAPPSKSMTHRYLITAALAEGRSELVKPLISDDTVATVSGLRAMGVQVTEDPDDWVVDGGSLNAPPDPINCNQSGTTLRLLLGTCSLLDDWCELTGDLQLLKRPNAPLVDALEQLGAQTESVGGFPPIKIKGKMRGGSVEIRGDVSSQFISSIILAAPYASEPVTVNVTTRLESRPYVQMTIDAMRRCGIRAIPRDEFTEISVPIGRYKPTKTRIEGDWSSGSFMLAAGVLSGKVHVDNLDMESIQADKEIMLALREMGAQVKVKGNRVTAEKSVLSGLEFDLTDCPDIFPVISVLCATAQGTSRLTGVERLRIKESDRLGAMIEGLRKMGANVKVEGNECVIGEGSLKGAAIDPHWDHRIAMSFAVLGTAIPGETTISDPDCVSKSYPGFWDDLASIGAKTRRTE